MQLQTDDQRGKRACALTAGRSISKAMKGLVAQQAVGRIGPQPWPRGARAPELIPPVRSVPRRRVLLREVEDTRQCETRCGNKAAAEQVSRRSRTSNWRPRVF